jgi:transposase
MQMTIHVGIDPGKDKHSVSFLTEGGDSNHCLTIANDRDGYHRLLDRLTAHQRSGHRVELAIEPSGHYWENLGFFLAKQGYDLKLVNPFHVSRYTEILDNSPTKTDRKDSHLIAVLLREGHALHNNLPQGSYAEVRRFTQLRRDALQERRKLRSKLHVWVDRYFPEYVCLFSDLAGPTSLGILAKYGCPQRIVEVTAAQLSRDLKELSRGKLGKARALKLQEQAARSVGQTVAYRAAEVELQLLIEKFQQNREELKLVEQQLRLVLEELPEAGLLQTIPGVGWWGAAVCGSWPISWLWEVSVTMRSFDSFTNANCCGVHPR